MTLSWGLAPVVSVLRIVISISFCCGVSADSPLGPWPCARAVRRTHTLTHLHIHVHGVSNASLGRCKACPSTVVSRPKNGTLKALSGARNTDAHSVYPPLGGPRRGAAGGRFHRHGGMPTRHLVDVRAVQAPWGPVRRMGCLRSDQKRATRTPEASCTLAYIAAGPARACASPSGSRGGVGREN